VGDVLFAKSNPGTARAILHIIGERPGTGQDAFSVYITAPKAQKWASKQIDHDITKVVCGISSQATQPTDAAKQTVSILKKMIAEKAPSAQ
jgi:ethanolamine ammonia-lyase large subunit